MTTYRASLLSPMKLPVPTLIVFAAAVLTASAVATLAASAPVRRVADLKSFFHGDAAMPPKAPPPPMLAVVATAAGGASDPQIEGFFRAFAAAVKAREGSRMTPYLSDNYAIADLPEEHSAGDFFAQAVDRTPGPEALTIQSVETKGDLRLVKVEFKYPTKTKIRTFQFDAAGKLLSSDLFTLKRVEHSL